MKKYMWFPTLLVSLIVLANCGPFQKEVSVEVKPNETAFVIPLEGETKAQQKKFESVEFLETMKIASKRIITPTRRRDTGRSWGDYEWIPTVKVITVDRTPITREWTSDLNTGTNKKNEGVKCESLESIGFSIGVIVTAFIDEKDTAAFLYYYNGVPLATLMDTNVRGNIQSIASREFGSMTLTECRSNKNKVFDAVRKEIIPYFKTQGVTIMSVGYTEGLSYENPQIQAAIDEQFKAEMLVKVAEQKQKETLISNQTMIMTAETNLQAANLFAQALEANQAKIGLDIKKNLSERWNGVLPSIMTIGAGGNDILMALDAKSIISASHSTTTSAIAEKRK